MLLSSTETQAATDFIDDELDPAHYQLLAGMTVKLTGGVKAGTFTGSGVVLATKNTTTWVLTAKHNLHVAAKKTDLAARRLADYFKQKISVVIDKRDGGTQSAAITAIIFADDSPEDHAYDVCILKIAGTNSQVFAQEVGRYLDRGGLAWMFASLRWQRQSRHEGVRPIFDLFDYDTAADVLVNGWGYSTNKGHTLLQLGHGKLGRGELASYGFGRRVIPMPAVANHSALMERTSEGYLMVFTFPSSQTDTALDGDSGGPVFAIDRTGTRSTLIGLHLGANHYDDRVVDDEADTANNAFTVVTEDIRALLE